MLGSPGCPAIPTIAWHTHLERAFLRHDVAGPRIRGFHEHRRLSGSKDQRRGGARASEPSMKLNPQPRRDTKASMPCGRATCGQNRSITTTIASAANPGTSGPTRRNLVATYSSSKPERCSHSLLLSGANTQAAGDLWPLPHHGLATLNDLARKLL